MCAEYLAALQQTEPELNFEMQKKSKQSKIINKNVSNEFYTIWGFCVFCDEAICKLKDRAQGRIHSVLLLIWELTVYTQWQSVCYQHLSKHISVNAVIIKEEPYILQISRHLVYKKGKQ